jgi:hypothetical protein
MRSTRKELYDLVDLLQDNDITLSELLITHARYCIGRKTILAGSFIDCLPKIYHKLPEKARVVIKRDLSNYLDNEPNRLDDDLEYHEILKCYELICKEEDKK